MLYETIPYENNSHFYTTFSNVKEEDYHKHKEMEVILVLRGKTNCTIHHLDYEIQTGDILIVDTQDLHRIYGSSDDLLMLTLYLNLEMFTEDYPNLDYTIFVCEDCTKDSVEKYQELQNKTSLLKSQMAKIMITETKGIQDEKIMKDHIHRFIDILVEQFQGFFMEDMKFKANQGRTSNVNLERLYRIVKYIYQNYHKDITLKKIADMEHLSHYYLSHLIKESTGLSFQNFLNYIRVEQAEDHLLEGKLNLTQISEFCGFSSPAYFNKCFKIWHGVTPREYKNKVQRYQRTHTKPFTQTEAMKLTLSYMNDYVKMDVPSDNSSFNTHLDTSSILDLLSSLSDEKKQNAYSYIRYLSESQD